MRPIHRGRHTLPIVVAAAMAMLAATPPVIAAAAPASSTSGSGIRASDQADNVAKSTAAPGSHTVTLLTGDRVTVEPGGGSPDSLGVTGPDGHRADARITQQGGDTYVYPSSAEPYVAAGLLDEDLFNVSRLIADGFDDAHTDGLPLIVSYGSRAGRSTAARALSRGAQDVRALSSINSTALTEDHARAAAFWTALTSRATASATGDNRLAAVQSRPALSGGAEKIWLDGKVHADLTKSTAQIGAPRVWTDGNTGTGVDVAVLDTGYDPGHPDLTTAVKSSAVFVPDEDVTDHVGHGTHVASTIAGSGAASGGQERGVAPGVNLHVGKVLDNGGSGLDSWIISGMQWAARDAKARVVSLSLGSDRPTDGTDPMSQAVDELSEETGALFTIAAGNAGPGDHTVAAPGAASQALTVGAVDDSDTVADFSSRGPRFRDDAPKPEITAPGVDILAARSQYATGGTGSYTTMSGTSMATPHVAGAAALVAAAHPGWRGSQIKDALISTAAATPNEPADAGGNGRVDAAAAAKGTLFATGTADAGIHPPGGAAGETTDRTLTWTNTADHAVTLDLTVEAPAPADGVFTLADSRLTVPAGGSTATTVTTHPDAAPAGNHVTGQVVATEGKAVRTRTLLSVSTREEDRHLRVRIANREGFPSSVLVMYQRRGDDYALTGYSDPDGLLDAVVPPGTYTVWTWIAVPGTHGLSSDGLALLSAPTVQVRAATDSDVILDATRVRQVKLTTPKASTDSDLRVDFSRSFGDGSPAATDSQTVGDGFDSLWALPTSKPASGDVLFTARWRMQQPLVALTSGGQDFDDLWVQPGSALQPTGDHTLPAVFAGDGHTEDYAAIDARGKVAVVRYAPEDDSDDEEDRAAADQVQAAQNEGVALLVMVNDLNGRLYEPVRKTPLTVVGLSRTEGETLIGRIQASRSGSVPMRMVTHASTGYLYDLVHTWRGGIPKDLSYAPSERQLARVDVDFRNDPALEVDEFRYDVQPYLGVKIGSTRLSHAGARRTDWVTADSDAPWMEEASAGLQSFQFSDLIRYRAGKTTDVRWFGPFDRPRINRSQPMPQRTGDTMSVTAPGWGDGEENHAGTVGPGTTSQQIKLYRGNRQIAENDGPQLTADVPAGKAEYRLVTTTRRTGYPYAQSTSTQWTFSSASRGTDSGAPLPLVQIDYAVPTRTDGTTTRNASLLVTPSHIPGVSVASVRTDSVDLSYDDGKTWHRATLGHSTAGAIARLHAPAGASYLTFRVHASDARGNGVTQTIVRAVGIG